MIIRDGTDPKIEKYKETVGITGDVYIIEVAMIESLESHKRLLSSYGFTPRATTIEEAEQERIDFEAEMERRRQDHPEPEPIDEEVYQKAAAFNYLTGRGDVDE